MHYLELGIHDLRTFAREIGVKSPTKYKRADLIREIELILSGEKSGQRKSRRGRPVKQKMYAIDNSADNLIFKDIICEVTAIQMHLDRILEQIQKK